MNLKIKCALLLPCFLDAGLLAGQNLIPNSGFEPACEGHAYILPLSTYIKPWFSPHSRSIFVDYYGRAQKSDSLLMLEKSHGQTFLVLDTYWGETLRSEPFSCRGYAITPLKKPLVISREYYFEVKVHIQKKHSNTLTNNFGAYFSTQPPRPDSCAPLFTSPQVINLQIIPSDNDWHLVSGTFTASDNFRYLTIGKFLADSEALSIHIENDFLDSNKGKDYKESFGTRFILDDARLYEISDKEYVSLDNIEFATGSYTIPSEIFADLDKIVNTALHSNYDCILIEGNTDNVGSDESNINLSFRRADSIKSYMTGKGVVSGKIICKGYGSSRPIAANDSETNRSLNRRVEIKFFKIKK
jgi:outer membrane protein OmpA-like peptidoglycan-associated protein